MEKVKIIYRVTIAFLLQFVCFIQAGHAQNKGKLADKPLFVDPVYNGAADPVVIWNKKEKQWFMFYTNRRATETQLEGVSWVHGTRIGIAQSKDGAKWTYRDTANINYRLADYTHWAPEVIEHRGIYHMYLTYVPGVFTDWKHPRNILHFTSKDLLNWDYQSTLNLVNNKVIDACVYPLPDGGWRMWYNNEMDGKSIYYADSNDLYHWTDKGKAIATRGEGPKVFEWKGKYWMVVDMWKGLGVFYSDDLLNWKKQEKEILFEPGKGKDDGVMGGHPDVVINDGKAYIFYFTHPGKTPENKGKDGHEQRRSVIQLAELKYEDGKLSCDRDQPVYIQLKPNKK
ncbi:Glycosyl hydrolase family 32 domain protein [Pseudopedobacter saltans DSM 12145]|uniref:Glycosyl hydrolase family 32 domain protein n=1 Tax=Pseudopedobacter saltans (strain ATCC 51119 / DSM 12145 / JCM 21818 / CCUG 39354 / LMG 10337 / NBRC 100064 / NCIMB 13643) TaxID=762903 RepID=F0S6D1_PSESL|nr:family 43 glycosylhydrolase [Pseudopedobacter saltans]ADY54257.1 Glycosyl hydrolase family 32 domain protein [Pseudopedobacter saltans DSM 12145]